MAKKEPIDYAAPPPYKMAACNACACRREASGPVPGRGSVQSKILVVGQNPSGDEDGEGRVFLGRTGKEWASWARALELADTDYYLTMVVKCHTEANRPPTATEANTCRDTWLMREVLLLKNLRAIITLGKVARNALLGSGESKPLTEASRAEVADANGRSLTVLPVPHPIYYIRAQEEKPYFLRQVLPELRKVLVEVGAV